MSSRWCSNPWQSSFTWETHHGEGDEEDGKEREREREREREIES
jgi:hypothetical protein